MHMPSSQTQRVSFRSRDGNRWVVEKPRDSESGLANPDPESSFLALIVDRDEMSSDLLATRLTRDGGIQASGVQSSDLLDRLADGKTEIVVIGADINHNTRTGFDLAHAVRRAIPLYLL